MLNLGKRAAVMMEDVSDASKKVGETTKSLSETADWAALALLAVAGVSIVAMMIAVLALERSSYER